MNWMYKDDSLAHYGVKGMRWHHKKKRTITFDNSSNAYQYDRNNNWFRNVTANTKLPGRSGTSTHTSFRTHLVSDNDEKERTEERITVAKRETIIDHGKGIVDDILKSIGDLFVNIFKKK